MKNANLMLYVVALFVLLVAFVAAVPQISHGVSIPYAMAGGLAAAALAQAGADQLEARKARK